MLLRNLFLFSILTVLFSFQAFAEGEKSNIRFVGSLGFGNAGAEREGVVKTEDPLALGFSAEYSKSSRFTFGFEHNRSWQGTNSNIGATGMAARWYLWTPHAQYLKNPSDVITETEITQKGYIPYIGTSAGFAQSSLKRKSGTGKDVSVAKAYVAAKFGIESPYSGPWGWRTEFSWTQGVVGEGTLQMMHLYFGIYYFL